MLEKLQEIDAAKFDALAVQKEFKKYLVAIQKPKEKHPECYPKKNSKTPLWRNQQYDMICGVETIKSDVRERICQPSGDATVEKGWALRGKQVPKIARPAPRRATAFLRLLVALRQNKKRKEIGK